MKTSIYTIEDEYMGIPFTIEGEVVDFEDEEPPEIIINDISHCGKYLEIWCFNERYIKHLQDRIFYQWCAESKLYRETVK